MDRAALAALLHRHQPADALEAAHRAAICALLDGPEDPFLRSSYTPGHVTASAFVLSPDRRRLLLIWHGKLHRWLQPGGHLDASDADIFAAARREVGEETGLTELISGQPELLDVDVHVIPPNPKRNEPEHRHFDVRILLIARDEAATAGDDALAVRWVPLEEVAQVETDDSVLRAVRRLRGA